MWSKKRGFILFHKPAFGWKVITSFLHPFGHRTVSLGVVRATIWPRRITIRRGAMRRRASNSVMASRRTKSAGVAAEKPAIFVGGPKGFCGVFLMIFPNFEGFGARPSLRVL